MTTQKSNNILFIAFVVVVAVAAYYVITQGVPTAGQAYGLNCEDTDNTAANILASTTVQGFVKVGFAPSLRELHPDRCEGPYIIEQKCSPQGNLETPAYSSCLRGAQCRNGACRAPTAPAGLATDYLKCEKKDGGDQYSAGTLRIFKTNIMTPSFPLYHDTCVNGMLTEYVCDQTSVTGWKATAISCPKGCATQPYTTRVIGACKR